MKISIVIPVLNEEEYLHQTIERIYENADHVDRLEILVIDSGSTDKTLASIAQLNVSTFVKKEFALKKYASLNFGLEQAIGDVVIFLDADTWLPKSFDTLIMNKLQDENVVGGAFEFAFIQPNWKLKLIEALNRIRYRLSNMYYGDQAVFCLKSVAEDVGGYPEKNLMESAFFCKRLLKKGKLKLIKTPIMTSPRRFNENGFYRVTWFDISMWFRFVFDLSVEKYGERYWGMNPKSDE